jgi:hypothetical protein
MAESKKKSFWGRISSWYEGELKVWDSPNTIGFNMERHWTAEVARTLVEFYLKHWQWLWGTVIGVASLWVAVIALK